MKTLFPVALLTLATLTLPGCGDDTPAPTPKAIDTTDVTLNLGMKGYAAAPAIVGSFGVSKSETEARVGSTAEGSGTISWGDTNGGKLEKSFMLAKRSKGEKLWFFVKASRKAQAGQSITLTLPGGNLTAVTAATDSLVVSSFTVQ